MSDSNIRNTEAHYFSTHGCVLPLDCFSGLGSWALLAAAAFLALRSKKELAIVRRLRSWAFR
jgi:hypothetical protein